MLRKIIIFGIIVVSLWVGGCADSELEEISLESDSSMDLRIENDQTKIYVYVCGAVMNPGVYALQEGSRVFEAVQAAGGFSADAAEEAVNHAEILQDEMRLYVPTKAEQEAQLEVESSKVNINTASKAELMELPGVGEAKAAQIISFREKNGAFKQIEDIMSISGIKEGLFEKIKEYITV